MHHFLMLGGDLRQVYLGRILEQNGHCVFTYCAGDDPQQFLKGALGKCDTVLCPVPFTVDKKHLFSSEGPGFPLDELLGFLTSAHSLFGGNIPAAFRAEAKANGITVFDFMEMEEVTLQNTVPTAEGAIAEAMALSPCCIHGNKCLVMGFGRCGKTLALKLKGLDARVSVADRSPVRLAEAGAMGFETVAIAGEAAGNAPGSYADFGPEPCEFIFNTIPAPVLYGRLLESVKADVTIIDIASEPGGVDFALCEERGLRAKLCPGLPGRFSPRAAAGILYDAVIKSLS